MSIGQESAANPRCPMLESPALIEWAQFGLTSAVARASLAPRTPSASNLPARGVHAAWWSLCDGRPGSDLTSSDAGGLADRSWLDEGRFGAVRDLVRRLDSYYTELLSRLTARAAAYSSGTLIPAGAGKTLLCFRFALADLLETAAIIDSAAPAGPSSGHRIGLVLERGDLLVKDRVDALTAYARACAAAIIREVRRVLRLMRALLRPRWRPGRTPTRTCTYRVPPLTGAITCTAPPSPA